MTAVGSILSNALSLSSDGGLTPDRLQATAAILVSGRFSDLAGDFISRVADVSVLFQAWIAESYSKAPALVAGLAAVLVVPLLALAGCLARWLAARARPGRPERIGVQPAPRLAALHLEGERAVRPIDQEMIRIGRQDDNELCLSSTSVHRYHAVISRMDEAAFLITDVSGPDGNGIRINGERIGQAWLADGDLIDIGTVKLRFEARAQ